MQADRKKVLREAWESLCAPVRTVISIVVGLITLLSVSIVLSGAGNCPAWVSIPIGFAVAWIAKGSLSRCKSIRESALRQIYAEDFARSPYVRCMIHPADWHLDYPVMELVLPIVSALATVICYAWFVSEDILAWLLAFILLSIVLPATLYVVVGLANHDRAFSHLVMIWRIRVDEEIRKRTETIRQRRRAAICAGVYESVEKMWRRRTGEFSLIYDARRQELNRRFCEFGVMRYIAPVHVLLDVERSRDSINAFFEANYRDDRDWPIPAKAVNDAARLRYFEFLGNSPETYYREELDHLVSEWIARYEREDSNATDLPFFCFATEVRMQHGIRSCVIMASEHGPFRVRIGKKDFIFSDWDELVDGMTAKLVGRQDIVAHLAHLVRNGLSKVAVIRPCVTSRPKRKSKIRRRRKGNS